ncbi:MAG: hypothetical protein ABL962_20095 [Fimbriimonadaceae bacterium]
MVAQTLGRDSQSDEFEVLLYTYFGGWTGFAYDDNDEPVKFGTIEEALADLQSAFDIWARQIVEGERTIDQAFSPDDFAIRSGRSGELCRILVSRNEVMLRA